MGGGVSKGPRGGVRAAAAFARRRGAGRARVDVEDEERLAEAHGELDRRAEARVRALEDLEGPAVVAAVVRDEPRARGVRGVDDEGHARARVVRDDERVLHGQRVRGQADLLPREEPRLRREERREVERREADGGRPVRERGLARVLGAAAQVREEARGDEELARQARELGPEVAGLRLPPRLLAAELAEEVLRLVERALGEREPRAELLGLARLVAELGLERGDAVVDRRDLVLALAEPERALGEVLLGARELGLEGLDLLEDDAVADVRLDPGRERRGRDGDARDRRLVEARRLLLEQARDVLAHLAADAPRVVVEDLVLDAAVPEELLHGRPAHVADAQELEHGAEDVRDGLGRHLEAPDLVEVLGLDLPHGGLGRLEDGLDAAEFLLDLALAADRVLLAARDLGLEVVDLAAAARRLAQRLRDHLHGRVGALLRLDELRLLDLGVVREAVDRRRRLLELREARREVAELRADAAAHLVVEHAPVLEEEHEFARRRRGGRLVHGRDRLEELVVDVAAGVAAAAAAGRGRRGAAPALALAALALAAGRLALAARGLGLAALALRGARRRRRAGRGRVVAVAGAVGEDELPDAVHHRGHRAHRVAAPRAHPQDRAAREERRVRLAAHGLGDAG